MREAAHRAVANGDEKALARHRGVRQHLDDGVLQRHARYVQRGARARHAAHVALHARGLAQQHIKRHVHRALRAGIRHLQLALLRGLAHHGKGRALALADLLKKRQRLGRNGQHVALLALVAPNLFGRQAAFFQRHGAQVKARATACIVHQLGESVGEAACAHVVNGQNGIGLAQRLAGADHFLRAALHFGVAALHRIKVQMRRVGPARQRTGRAAAHANAHARPAQLHQQRAGGKFGLARQPRVNAAHAASQHDGLVIAALHAAYPLLVFAKVARQIGAAKLVVERRAAQRPFRHHLQGAGHVLRLAARRIGQAAPELADGKARQARLRHRAPARGPFIANFAARARGRARERADGRGVVVRFHLHQHMPQLASLLIAARAHSTRTWGRFHA